MWKPTQTSNDVLMHSRGPWKKHKYIKVDANGNYIYPGDTINPARAAATALRRDVDTITARRRVEADRRNELNNRNLDAARNKAARKASAKRIAAENAERARRSARLRDQRNAEGRLTARKQIAEGNRDQLIRNAFRETARGIVRTAKEKDKQRLNRLRDQRNAEGRLSARKQIAAGNQRSRDEAARLKKLNAINTTRKAQRQGMARTEQVKAAEAARKKAALNERNLNAAKRKALNERNLNAARSKAARVSKENQLRERGMERTKQLKKQNAAAATERSLEAARNKATRIKNEKRYKEQRNAAGRLSARKQIAEGNRKRQDQINRSVRKQGSMKKGDVYNSENSARRNKAYRQSLDFGQRVNDIKSIKNPTARKNQARALAEETFYKNVKRPINKAAKSISSAAREAWNTASSYRDKFADFESFYKWYKKNVRK